MKGLILCGGESSRMGADKGLMLLHKENWVQMIAQNFELLTLPFIVSVNAKQYKIYSEIFSPEQLLIDDVAINVKGPLKGLLSVHNAFPDEDLLVLACDMIDMKQPPLINLLNNFKKDDHYNVYLYQTNNELQPLCAIYTANAFRQITNKLLNGKLERYSLKYILEDINACIATVPNDWLPYFNNYNTKEDLAGHNK